MKKYFLISFLSVVLGGCYSDSPPDSFTGGVNNTSSSADNTTAEDLEAFKEWLAGTTWQTPCLEWTSSAYVQRTFIIQNDLDAILIASDYGETNSSCVGDPTQSATGKWRLDNIVAGDITESSAQFDARGTLTSSEGSSVAVVAFGDTFFNFSRGGDTLYIVRGVNDPFYLVD